MIKRIIHIDYAAYISTEMEQLKISFKSNGEIRTLPIEDLGIVVLNNEQSTISSGALTKLSEYNAAVVICNNKHIPSGLLLPFDGNFEQTERIRMQIAMKTPQKKQAWMQIVKSKIFNQATLLESLGKEYKTLRNKADKVLSGDSTNQEASASRFYWKEIFAPKKFKRDRYGEPPNNLLNYGYAILRANTARAIVATGLHPSIGIFHKNKYNSFCLADDLMEPYRVFVDKTVVNLSQNFDDFDLSKDIKKELLGISFVDVMIDKKRHPLQIGVQISANSFYKFITGQEKKILLPELCD